MENKKGKKNTCVLYEYLLTDTEIKEMVKRKEDHLAGKITARPWNEIKKRYS